MKKRTQIALIGPLDLDFMRRVVLGVLHVAGGNQWTVQHFREDDELVAALSKWQPVGIIGMIRDGDRLVAVQSIGIPYVDVSGVPVTADVPQIMSDDAEVGSLAARHLLERGFSRFAYATSRSSDQPDAREAGFRKQVAITATGEISVYRDASAGEMPRGGEEPAPTMCSWVKSLSKPVGVMASSDALARQIIDASLAMDIRVPEDLAVVGVGNDEIICRMGFPGISSVSLPAERIGQEAATLLDGLIARGHAPAEPVVLPVSSVATRQSTDVVTVPDVDVAAAIRFIRAHSGEWIGVREVLLAVRINRRSLERKFRQYLGRSPLEEIRRVRMEIAKDLLSRTDLSMPIVARGAGFSEAKQLSLMFHNELKTTPTAYRKKFRLPAETQRAEGDEM